MDGKREVTSPTNLQEYIPNYSHLENSQHKELHNNTYSYRQSLEKKLEKLFKEERKGFNDSRFSVEIDGPKNYGIAVPTREAFTIEKMEGKIEELERKYLHSEPITEENINLSKCGRPKYKSNSREPKKHQMIVPVEQVPYRKTKSIYENNLKRKDVTLVCLEEKEEFRSDKKLLAEIDLLKKEIKWIKKSNLELNEKMEMKETEKQRKKERSKYLLNSILNTLIDIQEEVQRRDEKELRKYAGKPTIMTTAEERKLLKDNNLELQKQIGELNKQLRIEVNQKEIAEERSKWMESEMKKLGKG